MGYQALNQLKSVESPSGEGSTSWGSSVERGGVRDATRRVWGEVLRGGCCRERGDWKAVTADEVAQSAAAAT